MAAPRRQRQRQRLGGSQSAPVLLPGAPAVPGRSQHKTGPRPGSSSALTSAGATATATGRGGAFDPAKHGWYDTRHGRSASQRRCYDADVPGSYPWLMLKAKNHSGYGRDGRVNVGEVQGTAVSEDAPSWFIGSRTVPGPFSTKKHPIRRCPDVVIEGQGPLKLKSKTFRQGPGLEIIETLHNSSIPPAPTPRVVPNTYQNRARRDELDVPARHSHLYGGCVPRQVTFPRNGHNELW